MSGALSYGLGLVSSAGAAAVAGVPWIAVAAFLASVPYLAIGLLRAREALRTRQSKTRLLLR
jgi:hypothetical protein